MPVNYQVMERDGDMVWVKPPAEVATYYPSLMKEQRPEPEWLTPKPSVRLATADRHRYSQSVCAVGPEDWRHCEIGSAVAFLIVPMRGQSDERR